MAEIIPMTEEQKFKLEIYRLLSKNNSAAEEAFAFIGADQLKLELFKLHYNDGGAKAIEKSGGSPDQFLRQLNILQNQTGITFKGQDAAYLRGLKNYLQSTQQAAKAAVTTPTGQQTIPFIIGYGTAMNPATTGAAVSYGLLARAYESEPFRNAMLRMANTPRGSTAFEKAMQQAQKAINALTQGAKSDALSE